MSIKLVFTAFGKTCSLAPLKKIVQILIYTFLNIIRKFKERIFIDFTEYLVDIKEEINASIIRQ